MKTKFCGCAFLCCRFNDDGACTAKRLLINEKGECVMSEMDAEKVKFHADMDDKVKSVLGIAKETEPETATTVIGFKE